MTDEPWAAQVAKRARGEKQLSGSSEARAGRRRAIESREVPREGAEWRLQDRQQKERGRGPGYQECSRELPGLQSSRSQTSGQEL